MVPLIVLFTIFACFLLVLSAWYRNWKFNYWSNRNVKTLPVHPVFGNIADVVYQKIPMFKMITKSYNACRLTGDKYIGFYFLNKPELVVTDLALIKCILENDFKFNGVQLATITGSQWKSTKEKLTAALTLKTLETYSLVLKSVGEQLKEILNRATEKPNVLILQHLGRKFIMDVIAMTIFGIKCNTRNIFNSEFEYYVRNAFSGCLFQNLKIYFSIFYFGVLNFFRIPLHSKKIRNFFISITRKILEYRKKNNIVKTDLLHLLIQLRNDLVSEDKTEEIAAQLTLFFAAGYETSSITITFVLYEIMYSRYLQENLRSEINAVLKKHNGETTYEALMEMTYLESCIYETFRKHPAFYVVTRVCTSDYKVPDDNLVIEKGTTVIIPVINIHHDATYYPYPESFQPDRFMLKNRERHPNYAFLPFGEGSSSCIDSQLAILKIKLFIAILLKDFQVSINLKTKFPMQYKGSSAQLIFKEELLINIRKL